MGARSTGADLLAFWPTLTAGERAVYRVRTFDPTPLTLLVHDIRGVEATGPLEEERVEIRGYELSGPLAHLTGEQTDQGGTAQQVRARIIGRREQVEILDLDEPNEPGHIVVEGDVEREPIDVEPNQPEAPPGIEIDPVDHTWEAALTAAPGMPNTDGAIDATGGWEPQTSGMPASTVVHVDAKPGVLLATTVPMTEWANTSQLRLPRPVLDRLNVVARQRMIGRGILIAACIERGLALIENEDAV